MLGLCKKSVGIQTGSLTSINVSTVYKPKTSQRFKKQRKTQKYNHQQQNNHNVQNDQNQTEITIC